MNIKNGVKKMVSKVKERKVVTGVVVGLGTLVAVGCKKGIEKTKRKGLPRNWTNDVIVLTNGGN